MLLIASAVALSLATMKIPGGVLELPRGCSGPAEIPMLVDSYIGFISCDDNKTSILVEGSVLSPGGCAKDDPRFQSRHGSPMVACWRERVDNVSKKRIQLMRVDIGAGILELTIREPRDAFLLLQIASSFRPDRKQ